MPLYGEVILRSFLSFIALLAVCYLVGKKFDVVLPIAFGVIAAMISVNRGIRIRDGILALAVWGILTVAVGLIAIKSKQAQNVINGKPTVLIEGGNVIDKNLRKARMTLSDMMALLREKDAFKLADVESAVLEPDGQVSVMKKSDAQPITPTTAGIAVEPEQAPKLVIEDGTVMYNTLLENGYSEGWLLSEIKKQGADSDDDVFLAQLDSKDNVYVDLRNDVYKKSPDSPSTKSKLLLFASLKKLQSELEIFTLETKNPGAKTTYQEGAALLSKLISQVQPELTKKA